MTTEEYFKLDSLEEGLVALANGYYDTHDLDQIKKDEDLIKEKIEKINKAHYIIDEVEFNPDFIHYQIKDNKCVQTVVYAYTDGSAVVRGKSKGNGGFGTYLPNLFGEKVAYSLGFVETKTGRMEISALYYAIKAMPLRRNYPVTLRVYSDSEYVVKAFAEGRLVKWIQAGWRNTSGEVKNIDLWKHVLEELNKRGYMRLDMKHIRSHQVEKEKDPKKKELLLQDPHIRGNMVADRLADYKRHKTLVNTDKL